MVKLTRIQRLVRIMQRLQSGRRCDAEALLENLGVSRRTLFRDLTVLRDAGVTCNFDAERGTYSTDEARLLRPLNLTMDEGLAVLMLTRCFPDSRVLPNYPAAVSAGLKIESVLPASIRESCGELLERVDFQWPQTSDVDPISGVVISLQRAAAETRRIRLQYDSYYEKSEIETHVHPYSIIFQTRGWYLIGFSEFHGQMRTFKVERITDLIVTDRRFRRDPGFSLESYFGNAWNMVRGENRYHVEVCFSRKVAGNVEEVQWHRTQRTRRRSDGTLVFEADVDGIEEISWWILGYGDQAVVSEPGSLRRLIAEHARNVCRYYTSGRSVPVPRD